jgi:hypothetical protein
MNRPGFATPEDVAAWIAAAAPDKKTIAAVSLFCDPNAPGRALCLVDAPSESVPEVARRLGGQAFGFTSVTFTLPLEKHFACAARGARNFDQQRCTCRLAWPPA